MSDTAYALIVFALYHLFCDFHWRRERAEMVNRLMSRNFHDYQFSSHIEKTMQPDHEDLAGKIKAEDGLREDLAPIQGFGMN